MLPYDIYYLDIITFVFNISLFCAHNAQVHLAFCPQNELSLLLSVHGSISFCGHNAISFVLRCYGVSSFRHDFMCFVAQEAFCPRKWSVTFDAPYILASLTFICTTYANNRLQRP